MATNSKDQNFLQDFKKKQEFENVKWKELKEEYAKFIEKIKKCPYFCNNSDQWNFRSKLGMALAITRATYSDGSLNFKLFRKNQKMLYFIVSPADFSRYLSNSKPYTISSTLDEHGTSLKDRPIDDLTIVMVDDNLIPRRPSSVAFGTTINSQEVQLFYDASPSLSKSLSNLSTSQETQPLEDTQPIEDSLPFEDSLQKSLSRAPTVKIESLMSTQQSANFLPAYSKHNSNEVVLAQNNPLSKKRKHGVKEKSSEGKSQSDERPSKKVKKEELPTNKQKSHKHKSKMPSVNYKI